MVEMRLEELVMMPLENTYISFLQKNTCERVFVQTTLLFFCVERTRLYGAALAYADSFSESCTCSLRAKTHSHES